jgi:hypothetical protein
VKKKQKYYYIVVDDMGSKDNNFIEGAFPLTEEGKETAERYAKQLSGATGRKYKIKER